MEAKRQIKICEIGSYSQTHHCITTRNVVETAFRSDTSYQEYTYKEIGNKIGVTTERAFQICEEALGILQRCFRRHNIRSVGDLL